MLQQSQRQYLRHWIHALQTTGHTPSNTDTRIFHGCNQQLLWCNRTVQPLLCVCIKKCSVAIFPVYWQKRIKAQLARKQWGLLAISAISTAHSLPSGWLRIRCAASWPLSCSFVWLNWICTCDTKWTQEPEDSQLSTVVALYIKGHCQEATSVQSS